MKHLFKTIFFILIFAVTLSACNSIFQKNKNISAIEKIKQKGKIVAVTQNNSTDYFIYKGEPMGYQLELLQMLSDYLKIKLEVIVNNDLESNFKGIENGDYDIMAINLTVNKPRAERISFTNPIGQTRQVLVQRKPSNFKELSNEQLDNVLIRNQIDLGNKVIYVKKQSSYVHRLKNLSEEIGKEIIIVEVPDYEDEQLIEMVSDGLIDFTVCDENVAMVSQMYFDNIDIATPISFQQNVAWAVNKNSRDLLKLINSWLDEFKGTPQHIAIYNKYYKNDKRIRMINNEYFANITGKLSQYDEIIKENSKRIQWDWRLLASLICQESRFDPTAKSWTGAFGLMQFMPSTAALFKVSEESPLDKQIEAGTKYIQWLDKQFRQNNISSDDDIIKFILASYNVGIGHVIDAQKLAEKYGYNPNKWEDVSFFLLNKSNPKYYLDPDVKFGYCRGKETCAYVEQIIDRYNHYKNILADN